MTGIAEPLLARLLPDDLLEEVRCRFEPFLVGRVSPGAVERDRSGTPMPRELLREAGELGLMGFSAAKEVGGGGRSWREWGLVLHEVAYRCSDTSFPMLLAYCGTVSKMLYETGRSDLLDRYVRPMVRGTCLGGFGWSEGHDPFSFQTEARRSGDGYLLSGEKLPIANGLIADVFMIFAKDVATDDVICLLVEREDRGVEITPYNAMGLRAAGMARVQFHDVPIPAWRVLRDFDGLSYGQQFLNERRFEMPCWALGRMRVLFETCVAELSQRIRYGLPLTEMQAVQAAIGRMYVWLEASRLVVKAMLEDVERHECDPLWHPPFAVAKCVVIGHALQICRTVQSITGGAGVFEQRPYERLVRDLQCLDPIAGTLATLEVDLGILVTAEIKRRSGAAKTDRPDDVNGARMPLEKRQIGGEADDVRDVREPSAVLQFSEAH
jgi:alkylation response protein AidB-like acyl-CoA dehydrogenase